MNTPTAEQFILADNQVFEALIDGKISYNQSLQWIADWMKEFAKIHVKAALKEAYNNQQIEKFKKEDEYDYPSSKHFRATEYSILNAYPLENIK